MKLLQIALLSTMTIFLFGCATVGSKIDTNNISKLEKGVTTKSQVIALFGKPITETNHATGSTFLYIFAKTTPSPSTYIPVVNLFHSEMNTSTNSLSIDFDKDNIVTNFSNSNSDTSVQAGIL